MADILCEQCANYVFDEEDEQYVCDVHLDEDEMVMLLTSHYKKCPYYQNGDDYLIVRKQN